LRGRLSLASEDSAVANLVGRIVGNYEILAPLGEGGMGMVYRGVHMSLRRPAAIKVLLPQHSSNPDLLRRFFNEARATTAIAHPGIVNVFDFGRSDSGQAYIAMELLAGSSLADSQAARAWDSHTVLVMARQIASALGAAHDVGVVHRDLKPDNIFVCPDPDVPGGSRIKLLDFGIAKLTEKSEFSLSNSHTQTGSLIGTPAYMSPEQCRGVGVDFRTDLYALGCILFELFTGQQVFTGEGAGDLLVAHIATEPRNVKMIRPELSDGIAELVSWLLRKDPEQRPCSCTELMLCIDSLLDANAGIASPAFSAAMRRATPLPATPVTAAMVTQHEPPQSKPRRWLLGVALGSVALAGGVAWYVSRSESPASKIIAASPPLDAVVHDSLVAPQLDAAPQVAAVISAVTVTLQSTPPGATLLVNDTKVGATPMLWTRVAELAGADVKISFQLKGYQSQTVTVPQDTKAPMVFDVKLVRQKSTSSPAAGHGSDAGSNAPLDQNGGINPFGKKGT
jgi:hypothetical protein